MVNLVTTLTSVFERGVRSAFPNISVAVVVTPAAQEKFGDYQCNSAMNIAQVVLTVGFLHETLLYETFWVPRADIVGGVLMNCGSGNKGSCQWLVMAPVMFCFRVTFWCCSLWEVRFVKELNGVVDAVVCVYVSECLLWSPYGIGQTIIFSSCGYFCLLSSSFFPRLISAVGDWMSTILPHMVWP